MRIVSLLVVFLVVIFGSGYWYAITPLPCKTPVTYRIGDIDARFGTTPQELMRIAEKAERVWETAIGEDVFVYDAKGKLPISLVYDERQKTLEREEELRADLEATEGMNESVARQYEKLITEFRSKQKEYESRVNIYEKSLAAYNEKVADWNTKGGAPAAVVEELNKTAASLTRESASLEVLAQSVNALVTQLNAIGAKGNTLIKDYNAIVDTYNNTVGGGGEFTQGDYTQDAIHVYTFNSETELTLVLVHEFGHALGLDHVSNSKSIMYTNLKEQTLTDIPTREDMAEFQRVCEAKNITIQVLDMIYSIIAPLIARSEVVRYYGHIIV
jgi:predicted Zn-dependent protease